ncbi:MAG: SurA N-terminal domain-containing protein [Armatimonadetes bacterium]|nr:SurA N-terminal domain-containing protein [Armatimonadota bacterium]
MKRKGWWIAGLCALASVSVGQVDPARVVAVVNGEEIKGAEYYRRMEFLPGVGRFLGNRFAEMPPGFMTLDELISEKLVLQLAKKLEVSPSDAEIEAELRYRLEQSPNFLKEFTDNGISKDDVKNLLKLELAKFKIVTKGITFTDAEVTDHYTKNISRFTIPKRYQLSVIAVSNEDLKKKVDAGLAAGKSFEDVAKEFSEDLTKRIGGDLGLLPDYALMDPVREALNGVKIGGVTKWLQIGPAWAKYKFVDAKAAEKMPLTPSLREKIRREQMLVRGSIKNDLKKLMNQARKDAVVDIKSKEFADIYKKFIDQVLKDGGG